jgi:hypothetical protein
MRVRLIRQTDIDQIFECFKAAQVRESDIKRETPASGFYEYNLSYNDISERAQTPFSLVLENSRGEILSYMIGYPVSYIRENISSPDPVHEKIRTLEDDVVYADQVYLRKGLPLQIAMRLFDKWDFITQGEKTPLVIGAVPVFPWRNAASERMMIYRGFSRKGFVEEEKTRLALFEKPYYAFART